MYVPVSSALLGAGVVGGTDDAGLVAQLRGDDRRIDVDERHEVVALAAHATTDDDQRGAEVLFDQAVVLGQTLGPLLVAELLALAHRGGCVALGVALAALQLDVAELGVRDEHAS